MYIIGAAVHFVDCSIWSNLAYTHGEGASSQTAPARGGVVSCSDGSTVRFSACDLWNNSAVGAAEANSAAYGGVVYASGRDSTVDFENCTVSENRAHCYNNVFLATSARAEGGVVSWGGDFPCKLSFTRCTITGNSAAQTSSGGGVASVQGTGGGVTGKVRFTSCTLSGNHAICWSDRDGVGGVLIAREATVQFYTCTISGNYVEGIVGSTHLRGGALYASDSQIDFQNCIIYRNSAYVNDPLNEPIYDDSAQGGVAFVTKETHLTVSGCTVTENTAFVGGFAYTVLSYFDIRDTTFEANNGDHAVPVLPERRAKGCPAGSGMGGIVRARVCHQMNAHLLRTVSATQQAQTIEGTESTQRSSPAKGGAVIYSVEVLAAQLPTVAPTACHPSP